MTNPEILTNETIAKLLNTGEEKIHFIGFNEFKRTEEFWKKLNKIYAKRNDLELYLYSYSNNYDLNFLALMTDVKKLKIFRIYELEEIRNIRNLNKLQLWDGMKTTDLSFLKDLNFLEELYIRSKCKSFKNLKELNALRKLTIELNTSVKIFHLEGLSKLKELSVDNMDLSSKPDQDYLNGLNSILDIEFRNLKTDDLELLLNEILEIPTLRSFIFSSKNKIDDKKYYNIVRKFEERKIRIQRYL